MRKVEVFSAGCILCDDAVQLVKDMACSDCEVIVRDLHTKKGLRKAGEYGVTRVPTVVVDGRVASCCAQGGLDAGQLRDMGLGVPLLVGGPSSEGFNCAEEELKNK